MISDLRYVVRLIEASIYGFCYINGRVQFSWVMVHSFELTTPTVFGIVFNTFLFILLLC